MKTRIRAGNVVLEVRQVSGVWRCSYRDADNRRRQINSKDKAVAVEKAKKVAEALASRSRKVEVDWDEWQEFQRWKETKAVGAKGPRLGQVLEEFLVSEGRKSRRSEATYLKAKRYLTDVVEQLGPSRRIGDVLSKELAEQIHAPLAKGGKASDRTKLNRRRYLVHFWRWAQRHDMLPEGRTQAERTDSIDCVPGRKEILAPAEMERVITEVGDVWLPFVLLSGFAGVRHQEIRPDPRSSKRWLDWQDVKLGEGIVDVLPETAKGKRGRRRIIPIQPNLLDMLKRMPLPESGPVCPGRPFTEAESGRLAKELGKEQWPYNCLRHSYGTYRMAICRDAPRVSDEMGNSVVDVRNHYDAVATEKEGKAWWSLKVLKRCSNWRPRESRP